MAYSWLFGAVLAVRSCFPCSLVSARLLHPPCPTDLDFPTRSGPGRPTAARAARRRNEKGRRGPTSDRPTLSRRAGAGPRAGRRFPTRNTNKSFVPLASGLGLMAFHGSGTPCLRLCQYTSRPDRPKHGGVRAAHACPGPPPRWSLGRASPVCPRVCAQPVVRSARSKPW